MFLEDIIYGYKGKKIGYKYFVYVANLATKFFVLGNPCMYISFCSSLLQMLYRV